MTTIQPNNPGASVYLYLRDAAGSELKAWTESRKGLLFLTVDAVFARLGSGGHNGAPPEFTAADAAELKAATKGHARNSKPEVIARFDAAERASWLAMLQQTSQRINALLHKNAEWNAWQAKQKAQAIPVAGSYVGYVYMVQDQDPKPILLIYPLRTLAEMEPLKAVARNLPNRLGYGAIGLRAGGPELRTEIEVTRATWNRNHPKLKVPKKNVIVNDPEGS